MTILSDDSQKLLRALFGTRWEDAWLCWTSNMYGKRVRDLVPGDLPDSEDCYFSIALLKGAGRTVENAVSVRAVVLDDVGTKLDLDGCEMLAPEATWRVETSSGNWQWGYACDLTVEGYRALRLGMSTHPVWGHSDAAMDPVHLYRLPQGVNTKNGWKLVRIKWGDLNGANLHVAESLRGSGAPVAAPAYTGAKRFDWNLSELALAALVDTIPNIDDARNGTWIRVLHGISGAGGEFEMWDRWSEKWPGYDAAKTARAWDTLDHSSVRSGGGNLRELAEELAPDAFQKWKADWEVKEVFDDDPAPPEDEPEIADIVLPPEGLSDPRRLPRRPWLYGRRLLRGYLSSTVAAGGTGKSSLAIVEAMAMVTGKDLLGVGDDHMPRKPLRVLVWNGEDPKHELSLRLHATASHYGVVEADFAGRLFMLSGRDRPIRLGGPSNKSDLAWLRGVVRGNRIDVVIVDPFVSSHGVSENDNMEIDRVAKTWAALAEECSCAVELVHHIRKPSGGGAVDLTVDDARGASALVNASRNARVLSPMSDKTAKESGVVNRKAYFAIQHDATKANMVPGMVGASWFKFCSVDLGNGDPFPVDGGAPVASDSVGVVEAWVPSIGVASVPANIVAAQGEVVKGSYRRDAQSPDWVGAPIGRSLGLDPAGDKAIIKGIVDQWIAKGFLVVVEKPDARRKPKNYVEVGAAPPTFED